MFVHSVQVNMNKDRIFRFNKFRLRSLIVSEEAIQFHLNDSEKSFTEYSGTHLRYPSCSICKYDRYFNHIKSILDGCKFHFDLKGIAYEFYFIERYGF